MPDDELASRRKSNVGLVAHDCHGARDPNAKVAAFPAAVKRFLRDCTDVRRATEYSAGRSNKLVLGRVQLIDDGQFPLNEGGRAPTLERHKEVFVFGCVAMMMQRRHLRS